MSTTIINKKMPKTSIAHLLDYTADWESLSSHQIVCTSRMSTGMVTNDEDEKGTPMPTDHTDAATAKPKYTDQSTRSLPPSKIITVRNRQKSTPELIILTLE